MKTILNLVLSSLLLCGCASVPQQQRIASASKVAAYVGTTEFLRSHPEARPGFEAARDSLRVLGAADHVDLITLLAVINKLPVKELKSDRATMIITVATLALSDYAGSLPVDKLDDLKPVAMAIAAGIDLGLQ